MGGGGQGYPASGDCRGAGQLALDIEGGLPADGLLAWNGARIMNRGAYARLEKVSGELLPMTRIDEDREEVPDGTGMLRDGDDAHQGVFDPLQVSRGHALTPDRPARQSREEGPPEERGVQLVKAAVQPSQVMDVLRGLTVVSKSPPGAAQQRGISEAGPTLSPR